MNIGDELKELVIAAVIAWPFFLILIAPLALTILWIIYEVAR